MQTQTQVENGEQRDIREITQPSTDIEKLEALVTPDQVLSANVARKRRKYSKKRSSSASRMREQTPARDGIGVKASSTDSDETKHESRPKTPERRRRRVTKSVSRSDIKSAEEIENAPPKNLDVETGKPPKKHSFTDVAQAELLAFCKAAVSRGRERFKKHDKLTVKRSQSTPNQLSERELIESFKKAQLLSYAKQSKSRKYSTDSSIRSSPDRLLQVQSKSTNSLRRRPRPKPSKKIVEIIDPSSFNLVYPKTKIADPPIKIFNLIRVLRRYSLIDIIRGFKLYKLQMKHEYDKIRYLRNKCIGELMLIIIFFGLGGILFKFIEGAFENFYKCGVKRVKRDFIDTLWYKSHNMREEDWKSLARNRLRTFEEELHQAHEAGIHSYTGQRSWSFLNGVSYALTVASTIGYGHVYPITRTGQALTIVYSIIGIPLFLIALTDFGKLFTRCIKFAWSYVRRLYYTGSCRQVRKTAHVQEIFKGAQMMYEIATFRRPSQFNIDPEAANNIALQQQRPHTSDSIHNDTPTTPAPSNYEIDEEFNLPVTLAIFILVLYIFLGAVFYMMTESWDFMTAFYFVFISMSTIGFGDYVPKSNPIFMMITIIYLVFGLALMSMCINVVQIKLSDTFSQASAKIGATIGLSVAEDDGSIVPAPTVPVEMPEVHGGKVKEGDATNENGADIKVEQDDEKEKEQ